MRTHFIPLSLFVLFVLASIARADEAHLAMSSGVLAPIDGTGTDIRMVSERVVIELGEDNYMVDATFEFFNDGDTVTIPVGFPDYGYGYLGTFKGVKTGDSFETRVNGKPAAFSDAPGWMLLKLPYQGAEDIMLTDPDILNQAHENLLNNLQPVDNVDALTAEELRWFVKQVDFPGGDTTTTRVRYVAEYGNWAQYRDLEYLFGTGRSWKGPIGRAEFVIKTSPEVWMSAVPDIVDSGNHSRVWQKERPGEYEHVYILADLEPAETEKLRVFTKAQMGKYIIPPWDIYADHTEFDYIDKVVDDDFLDIMSLSQLRLFRNAFYALHGKVFSEPDLAEYFGNSPWYKPSSDYKESDLTAIDSENIRRIEAKEQWLRDVVAKEAARRQ